MGKAIAGAAMIAGAVVLDVATGGAAAPFTSQMLMAGISMEAGAIAHALGSRTGIGITTRQAAAYRQLILGEYRVGAVNVFRSTTGSHHDQFNFVDVLAGHEIDSIVGMYLDGRQIYWAGAGAGYGYFVRNGVGFGGIGDSANHNGPGGQQYNFGGTGHAGIFAEARYGDQTMTYAGPTYPAGTPGLFDTLRANDPNWNTSGTETPVLMGCAAVYFKCEYNPDLFPSEPERRYTVRGVNNVWDPRDGTYKWTNNWALLVAWMLTDTTFGLGDVGKVNQAQLIAAANVCDEMVPLANGNTEKRYTLNKAYDTGVSPGDMIADAMKAAGGRLSYVGGEWFIHPRTWVGVSYSFSQSMITGPVQFKPYRGLKDRCNRVRGTYMAPNVPYNDAGNLYDSNGWYNGTTLNNWPYNWHPTNYPQYAVDPQHGYANDPYLEADSQVQGPWDSGTEYAKGDVVTDGGVIFMSLADANLANQPSTHSWAQTGAAGVYAGGTTYAEGDAAVYLGQLYVSLVSANTGNQPDTSPTDWAPVLWQRYQNLLPLQLDMDNVLSITQAQRNAKIELLSNRQGGRGTIPLHLACYGVQPLDVITVDNDDLGWYGKVLEVVNTRFYDEPDPNDQKSRRVRFEIDVQETDPSITEWSTTEELTAYDVPANPTQAPWGLDAPTGLVLVSDATTMYNSGSGTIYPQIQASWDGTSVDARATQIQVQYQKVGAGTWSDYGSVASTTTSALIGGSLVAGAQYNVRIRVISSGGSTSAWTQAGPVTAYAQASTILIDTVDFSLWQLLVTGGAAAYGKVTTGVGVSQVALIDTADGSCWALTVAGGGPVWTKQPTGTPGSSLVAFSDTTDGSRWNLTVAGGGPVWTKV